MSDYAKWESGRSCVAEQIKILSLVVGESSEGREMWPLLYHQVFFKPI